MTTEELADKENDQTGLSDKGERTEVTTERPDESKDSVDFKVDLKAPKGLEKEFKELETQFRSAYLKNTSEKAEKLKALEAEKERLTTEASAYKKMADDFKVRLNPPVENKEVLPQFETVEQMVQFLDKKAESKVNALVEQKLQQFTQVKAYEDKWVNAWNTVAEKEPRAALYRELVKNELMNRESPYLKLYNGSNETEVLQKTLRGIRDIFQKEIDMTKQETIKKMKDKTSSVTEKGGKATKTTTTLKDRDAIIQAANDELGPPPGLAG